MRQNETFNNIKHDHALPKASAHDKRGFISICKGEMDNLNRNSRCLAPLPSPTSNNTLTITTQKLSLIWERMKTQNSLSKENRTLPKLIS
jgi:hypothetical protein